jgi:cysteine-rich repeat protein
MPSPRRSGGVCHDSRRLRLVCPAPDGYFRRVRAIEGGMAALMAFVVLAVSWPARVEAAPSEAEARCYSRKLSVSAYHAKKLGTCHGKLARGSGESSFDACRAAVDEAVVSRLAVADRKVGDPDFVCAGDLDTLALGDASSWQHALVGAAVVQANTLPNACVEKRVRALARFASKYASCIRRSFDSSGYAACEADSLPSFTSTWSKAATLAPCTSDDAAAVAASAVSAINAQALLLHVQCGDGQASGYEACDDGNLATGDGCDGSCVVEECGNGIVQSGETCDDGGASADCDDDCTAVECGDGLENAAAGEGCDDGNLATGDGCDGACLLEACGDGLREAPEECDDGNVADEDGCSASCRREHCGQVGAEVRCMWCPDGEQPDATYTSCTCAPGFAAAGAGCVDVDECAANPCGAAPCENLPGSWSCPIPCTEAAFHAALQGCGGASRTITFDCADTTIPVTSGANGPRRTSCDGLTVDGLDRNITFEMTPACFGQVIPAEQCRVALDPDGTCPCPEENSGTVFLSLEGDGMTVRNLSVRHFFDGIKTDGDDNTVENVEFERLCDEAVGSNAGTGNVFTGIRARNGCGKCMQSYGNIGATASDPRLRGYYNAALRDSVFTDCQQPIRTTESGRFLVESTRMEGFHASGMFRCLGPRFTSGVGHTQVVHFVGSTLDGCDDGLRIGGSVGALVWRNTFVGNEFRGVLASANARVAMWDNVVLGNGGLANSEGGLGGVGVIDAAQVDLGGGSIVIDGETVESSGFNVLCENVSPMGAPREVHNTTAAAVPATNNYWCTTDPQTRVTGSVITTPFLTEAP